jgi:hypothetical protein
LNPSRRTTPGSGLNLPVSSRVMNPLDAKLSAGAAVSRSRAVLPSSQKPPESSGAALPARNGVKSHFGCPWGSVRPRSSTAQTPATRATPKRWPTAGADGPPRPVPCRSVGQLGGVFSLRRKFRGAGGKRGSIGDCDSSS